jgi:hypothetical protein
MAYLTVSTIAADAAMRSRVAAAYAVEQNGPASVGAEQWAYSNAYWWASAPGWADAWDYAVNSGNTTPGDDPAVITDAMILSQVQLMLTPPPPPDVINPNPSWPVQQIIDWLAARGVTGVSDLSKDELLSLVQDLLD